MQRRTFHFRFSKLKESFLPYQNYQETFRHINSNGECIAVYTIRTAIISLFHTGFLSPLSEINTHTLDRTVMHIMVLAMCSSPTKDGISSLD